MIWQQDKDRQEENENSDKDEEYCSLVCKINSTDVESAAISWIECGSCGHWYHTVCVGLGQLSDDDIKKY